MKKKVIVMVFLLLISTLMFSEFESLFMTTLNKDLNISFQYNQDYGLGAELAIKNIFISAYPGVNFNDFNVNLFNYKIDAGYKLTLGNLSIVPYFQMEAFKNSVFNTIIFLDYKSFGFGINTPIYTTNKKSLDFLLYTKLYGTEFFLTIPYDFEASSIPYFNLGVRANLFRIGFSIGSTFENTTLSNYNVQLSYFNKKLIPIKIELNNVLSKNSIYRFKKSAAVDINIKNESKNNKNIKYKMQIIHNSKVLFEKILSGETANITWYPSEYGLYDIKLYSLNSDFDLKYKKIGFIVYDNKPTIKIENFSYKTEQNVSKKIKVITEYKYFDPFKESILYVNINGKLYKKFQLNNKNQKIELDLPTSELGTFSLNIKVDDSSLTKFYKVKNKISFKPININYFENKNFKISLSDLYNNPFEFEVVDSNGKKIVNEDITFYIKNRKGDIVYKYNTKTDKDGIARFFIFTDSLESDTYKIDVQIPNLQNNEYISLYIKNIPYIQIVKNPFKIKFNTVKTSEYSIGEGSNEKIPGKTKVKTSENTFYYNYTIKNKTINYSGTDETLKVNIMVYDLNGKPLNTCNVNAKIFIEDDPDAEIDDILTYKKEIRLNNKGQGEIIINILDHDKFIGNNYILLISAYTLSNEKKIWGENTTYNYLRIKPIQTILKKVEIKYPQIRKYGEKMKLKFISKGYSLINQTLENMRFVKIEVYMEVNNKTYTYTFYTNQKGEYEIETPPIYDNSIYISYSGFQQFSGEEIKLKDENITLNINNYTSKNIDFKNIYNSSIKTVIKNNYSSNIRIDDSSEYELKLFMNNYQISSFKIAGNRILNNDIYKIFDVRIPNTKKSKSIYLESRVPFAIFKENLFIGISTYKNFKYIYNGKIPFNEGYLLIKPLKGDFSNYYISLNNGDNIEEKIEFCEDIVDYKMNFEIEDMFGNLSEDLFGVKLFINDYYIKTFANESNADVKIPLFEWGNIVKIKLIRNNHIIYEESIKPAKILTKKTFDKLIEEKLIKTKIMIENDKTKSNMKLEKIYVEGKTFKGNYYPITEVYFDENGNIELPEGTYNFYMVFPIEDGYKLSKIGINKEVSEKNNREYFKIKIPQFFVNVSTKFDIKDKDRMMKIYLDGHEVYYGNTSKIAEFFVPRGYHLLEFEIPGFKKLKILKLFEETINGNQPLNFVKIYINSKTFEGNKILNKHFFTTSDLSLSKYEKDIEHSYFKVAQMYQTYHIISKEKYRLEIKSEELSFDSKTNSLIFNPNGKKEINIIKDYYYQKIQTPFNLKGLLLLKSYYNERYPLILNLISNIENKTQIPIMYPQNIRIPQFKTKNNVLLKLPYTQGIKSVNVRAIYSIKDYKYLIEYIQNCEVHSEIIKGGKNILYIKLNNLYEKVDYYLEIIFKNSTSKEIKHFKIDDFNNIQGEKHFDGILIDIEQLKLNNEDF